VGLEGAPRRGIRRWTATAVVVGVGVVPLTVHGSTPPSEPPATESTVTVEPETGSEFFARVGVSVVAIDDAELGAAGLGLSLTDWQADNLYRQARAGEGWTGAQWRERFPLPDDVMPVDFVIAGWLVGQATDAAVAARTLVDTAALVDTVAPMDPADLVLAPAVVALFLHDVAITDSDAALPTVATTPTVLTEPTGTGASGFGGRPHPAQVDACEGILTFYDGALASIYDLVGGKDTVIGQLAQQAVGLLPIPKPAYAVPRKNDMGTFQALGLLIGLAGAINPWTISITTTPEELPYGVTPAPGNEGVARLIVDPGISVEWPPPLKSCASLAGLELPDISPVGAVVFWDPVQSTDSFGPHATVVDHTDVVMSDGTQYYAELRYRSATESPEQAAGTPSYTALPILAEGKRPGDQTFEGVANLAISRYFGPDSTFGAVLGSLVQPLLESLDEINSPLPTYAFPTVTFHLPPEPPTSGPPVPSAPPTPTDEPWGACTGRDLYSIGTPTMPAGVRLRIDASGTAVLFEFTGSDAVTTDAGGVTVTVQLAGSLSGSATATGNVISTSLSNNALTGVITVGGQPTPMDANSFSEFVAIDEHLICGPDGIITVQRTGQQYA